MLELATKPLDANCAGTSFDICILFAHGTILSISCQVNWQRAPRPLPLNHRSGTEFYPGGKPPARIPADSPPAFLLCANDDESGCDKVTMELLQKFRAASVPVEAHLLAQGKHAFNMGDRSSFAAVKNWPQRMADWLADCGLLTRQTAAEKPAH